MGVRSVYGPAADPLDMAKRAVADESERLRRDRATNRRRLYLDDSLPILQRRVDEIFRAPEVRVRIKPFLPLAAAQSLFKRVIDEKARPVYSPPPLRKICGGNERDELNFALLSAQCNLDARMDLACKLMLACNTVHLLPRYVTGLGVVLDIITPDQRTIIPHPDDPTREIALIYDLLMRVNGKVETLHVYWDDTETFRFNERGNLVAFAGDEYVRQHRLGLLPLVPIHQRERWGTYEDETSGDDLAEGSITAMLIHALVIKLHRDQGEKQIVATGDIAGMPKGQTIDGGGAVVVPEGVTLTMIDLATDPRHYLTTLDAITRTVAANHGMSADRINAKNADAGADVSLLERRAEAIRVMAPAERRLYEVLKAVSKDFPLAPSSYLEVAFAEITTQADPAKTLEIWDKQIRMGLRSPLDCVREMQPEITTREQANAEIRENASDWAEVIDLLRKLNVRSDADVMQPGQTAATNGASGPAVRDGKMTAGEARDKARGDARSTAREMLRKVRSAD